MGHMRKCWSLDCVWAACCTHARTHACTHRPPCEWRESLHRKVFYYLYLTRSFYNTRAKDVRLSSPLAPSSSCTRLTALSPATACVVGHDGVGVGGGRNPPL